MSAQRKIKAKNLGSSGSQPGLYTPTILVTKTFRFKAPAGSSIDVSPDNLAVMYSICTIVNQVRPLTDRIKLNYVELWAPSSDWTSPSRSTVEWAGVAGNYGPSVRHEVTQYGSGAAGHLRSRAPSQSTASFWHLYTDNTDLVTIRTVSETIIDVNVTFPFYDGTASLTGMAALGASVGLNYFEPLDGPNGTVTPWTTGVNTV